jgi:hypothetical protein
MARLAGNDNTAKARLHSMARLAGNDYATKKHR